MKMLLSIFDNFYFFFPTRPIWHCHVQQVKPLLHDVVQRLALRLQRWAAGAGANPSMDSLGQLSCAKAMTAIGLAVAVPADKEPPIVLDMATTVAAYGKVKTKAQRGEMMPEGWMMDRQGKPLLDPKKSNDGFLLPIGGYKGYGLSMIIGLLAGTLNGAANGRDVVDFNVDNTTPTNTGHVIVAINVAMFQPVAEFKQSVDAFVRDIRNSQRLPGVDAIRLPGEGSHARLQESLKLGAPLSAPLVKSLNDLAAELKIPALR